jgi:hypothetical protein
VRKAVKDWLSGLSTEYYDAGMEELIIQYNESLTLCGDYGIM